jgi:hypothetical protein
MKGTIATLLGIFAVGAALAMPAVSYAQAPGELQRQRKDNFPAIHEAIQQLQHAKQTLTNEAAGDFHGHKQNAIKHIDEAIQELRLGIQGDRKH